MLSITLAGLPSPTKMDVNRTALDLRNTTRINAPLPWLCERFNRGMSADQIYHDFLFADLNKLYKDSVLNSEEQNNSTLLPQNVARMGFNLRANEGPRLKGTFVLQIDEVVNVAASVDER